MLAAVSTDIFQAVCGIAAHSEIQGNKMNMNKGLSVEQFHGLTSEILAATSSRGSIVGNLMHHLVFFGTALGQYPHIWFRGKIYPALNCVLIGPTACGKGESLKVIEELYTFPKEQQYLLAPCRHLSLTAGKRVAQTIKGVLDDYEDGECRFLSIDEECTSQIKCSAIWNNTISAVAINLMDGNEITEIVMRKTIHLPPLHFGSIGHITPLSLVENLRIKDMTNGFANRMLFIGLPTPEYDFDEAEEDQNALADVRGALIESLDEGGERQRVSLDEAAMDYYKDFVNAHRNQKGINEHLLSLEVRFPQMCLKIALIIALTNREQTVSRKSMEEACAIMAYSRQTLEGLYGGSAVEAPEHVVLNYLAQNGKTRRTELMQNLSPTLERSVLDTTLERLVDEGAVLRSIQRTARGRRPEYFELAPAEKVAA